MLEKILQILDIMKVEVRQSIIYHVVGIMFGAWMIQYDGETMLTMLPRVAFVVIFMFAISHGLPVLIRKYTKKNA